MPRNEWKLDCQRDARVGVVIRNRLFFVGRS
jgi:hypothetical protein